MWNGGHDDGDDTNDTKRQRKETNFTVLSTLRSLATFYECFCGAQFGRFPDRECFMNHDRGFDLQNRTQFQRLAALNLPQSFSSSMTVSPSPCPLPPLFPTPATLHAPWPYHPSLSRPITEL